MLRKYSKLVVVVIVISALAIALPCSDASAQPRGGDGRGRSDRGRSGGGRHYYSNGGWYRHGWLGFDIAVSALAIGALIDSLPPRYTTVVVAGTPYYYYDNYYYRPYPNGGYVVVPPPVLAQPAVVMPQQAQAAAVPAMQAQPQEASTINIPNSRGGYTAVTLKRAGSGFIGPQGEYYSDNPTVEQLKVLYGK
jgi:hypothetical protein